MGEKKICAFTETQEEVYAIFWTDWEKETPIID